MIEITNLSKSYVQGDRPIPVLVDLELSVPAGQKLAIVGPSGSGKSTLLALLAGLDKPDRGAITASGKSLGEMSTQQLAAYRRDHTSIVYQDFQLFDHLTAYENVFVNLMIKGFAADQAEELSTSWLANVSLSHRLHHKPKQLSGGEQQRVALARALSASPKLLLADEPSGNLDERTGAEVMDLLFGRVGDQNLTLILVTHDHALADRCDRKVVLKDGHLSDG